MRSRPNCSTRRCNNSALLILPHRPRVSFPWRGGADSSAPSVRSACCPIVSWNQSGLDKNFRFYHQVDFSPLEFARADLLFVIPLQQLVLILAAGGDSCESALRGNPPLVIDQYRSVRLKRAVTIIVS